MSQQNTFEINEVCHLQDAYTRFYGIIGNRILADLQGPGERALREATRRYGADRGRYRRQRHIDANVKINMKSLFSIGSDLPADPRFGGELQTLKPEQRTLFNMHCPMADVWRDEGMGYVGRLYCEEFHPACYSAYAFGYTKVNLSKTLTQEGDGYCAFNIVLRPSDVPDNLKAVCFEEYDPEYSGQSYDIPRAEAKSGFGLLCVKVLYYIVQTLDEEFGEEKTEYIISKALQELAEDSLNHLRRQAEEDGQMLDSKYFERNYPLRLDAEPDPAWSGYRDNKALSNVLKYFFPKILKSLN